MTLNTDEDLAYILDEEIKQVGSIQALADRWGLSYWTVSHARGANPMTGPVATALGFAPVRRYVRVKQADRGLDPTTKSEMGVLLKQLGAAHPEFERLINWAIRAPGCMRYGVRYPARSWRKEFKRRADRACAGLDTGFEIAGVDDCVP